MMANEDYRYAKAQREAEKFLEENNFDTLPVNLDAIADHLNIKLIAKPPESEGASGMLLIQRNEIGICYATHIQSRGFKRFSIAHEIGHVILEGHIEHILPDRDGQHISQAGFTSQNLYEIEADNFAASLLMPSNLFKKEMRKSGEGLEAIKKLAEICQTSLISTAIRYTEFTKEHCAIIVSKGTQVKYACMSKPLRELPNIEWISKGSAIPENTLTKSFNERCSDPDAAKEDSISGNLADWCGGYDLEIQEDVIGVEGYRKTLTVITVIQDIEEFEEERELEESLQIKFK